MSRKTLGPDDGLEHLADHCIEARRLVDRVGTASMRRLVDLLLFEVAQALSKDGCRDGESSEDDAA